MLKVTIMYNSRDAFNFRPHNYKIQTNNCVDEYVI